MKKGAVAGAIVWSAPLLTSSPAFAATGKCSGSKPCTNFYYLKNEQPGTSNLDCSSSQDGKGSPCPPYESAALSCDGTTPPPVQNGCNQGVTIALTGTTATFTYAAGVVPIIIQLKPGDNCFTYDYNETTKTFGIRPGTTAPPAGCLPVVGPATPGLNGSTVVNVLYPATCPSSLSHVATYFCK